MKKAGVAGNTGRGRKASTGASTVNHAGARGQKRGRPAKATPKTYDEEEEEEWKGENQDSEVMPEAEHDSEEEDETPAKKTKFGDVADSELAKNALTSGGKK
jgi:hypothetical protein